MPLRELDLDGDGTTKLYFFEGLYKRVGQYLAVDEVLFSTESRKEAGPQDILVLKTPQYGVVLVINGVVQTTEGDEYFYHEVVHCAANSCIEDPGSVLIIGCDGGMLRELVKYDCFSKIIAVDIDRRVIDLCEMYLPALSDGAWKDQRVKLMIDDGAKFVKEAIGKKEKYDLIVVDSPDPIGCAASLFETSFYGDIAKILSPSGIVIRQTGSFILQPGEVHDSVRQMQEVFPEGDVQVFITSVATYIGGYFTFVAASPRKHIFHDALLSLDFNFSRRMPAKLRSHLRWYSSDMHRAAISLPPELARDLKESEWGRELYLDLHECDEERIILPDYIAEYARKICKVINMKPFGDPWVQDFGSAMARTAGASFTQPIETSLVSGHFSIFWRLVPLNIFTCSTLDSWSAVKFSMDFFKSQRAVWWVMPRGRHFRSPMPQIDMYFTQRANNAFETTRISYHPDLGLVENIKNT